MRAESWERPRGGTSASPASHPPAPVAPSPAGVGGRMLPESCRGERNQAEWPTLRKVQTYLLAEGSCTAEQESLTPCGTRGSAVTTRSNYLITVSVNAALRELLRRMPLFWFGLTSADNSLPTKIASIPSGIFFLIDRK